MTIFGVLESGRSALQAQLKGMEVSGQNVANANTPGYSRQRVEMAAASPALSAGLALTPGYGVDVTAITRVRNEFFHCQTLEADSCLSYWEALTEAFQGAETIFMEPGPSGLAGYLNDFFDSWQELSSSPESAAVRFSLREQAISLTDAVKNVYSRLDDLRNELTSELTRKIQDADRLAAEVALLNDQIVFAAALGQTPNALLDQRDKALSKLSELVDIRVHAKAGGSVEVFAGGRVFIQDQQRYRLDFRPQEGLVMLTGSGRVPLELRSGRLKGLWEATSAALPGLQADLNRLVASLAEGLNRIHVQGYGLSGNETRGFFAAPDGSETPLALQFRLDEAVLADVDAIAAADSPGEPGNGANALAIARLRDADPAAPERPSLMDRYRGLISTLGVEGRESQRMAQAFREAADQLRSRHESVAGVNVDEEALAMMQYGHAWQAAASFIGHMDRLLETLLREL